MKPEIRKNSLEYDVKECGKFVLKIPNPGFEFKVQSDFKKFEKLGDLAPKTKYNKNNTLTQERIIGRFVNDKELNEAKELIKKTGFIPRGLLNHDVIMDINNKIKIVDVGNFEMI